MAKALRDPEEQDLLEECGFCLHTVIGKAAQAKHRFQVGVSARGKCQPVAGANTETVDYYKVPDGTSTRRTRPLYPQPSCYPR